MSWPDRRTSSSVRRSRTARSLVLLAVVAAAAACTDAPATAPRFAAPRARADVGPTPTPIDSFRIDPDSIPGSYYATGTLVLHAPAPAGGATVVITSSNNAVAWVAPDSLVIVPAGTTRRTFTIFSGPDPVGSIPITFSATYLGQTRTENLTVYQDPPPVITLYPGSLNFGWQPLGTTSAPQTVFLENFGSTGPLLLGAISVSGPFTQTNDCPTILVHPGDYCHVWVSFKPTINGLVSGTLLIPNSSPNNPAAVGLSGVGYVPAPGISVTPTSIGFPSVALGLATSGRAITIKSTGNAPLVVSSVSLGGANPGDFSLWDPCSGTSLAPGASCSVWVSFEPLRVGSRTATVNVVHNAGGGSSSVSVSGTGLKPAGGIIP
ncbi:hypothetical protein J421_5663 (plasmid) [Gemmatirosa kalamazoonensis]|uniref:Abnormal spindle-like microcephaly-associated protein ASH domain-containing protein n=1 Tax=Gemmatirosa kalamazoonensis TaxID=861299 RepID=W0RUG9_9BACT|nr:choice-of-anchor D domain-containing protein [Gemmatirosa kalamazoonensis]AHG93198.1 hypothetical protein J421_5663 [Gemmatirosa kalamazoonensis]